MAVFQSGVVIGSYRVDGLLGRGGMASVYHAVDEALDRPVALKILDPALASNESFVARFRREGALQASLDHPRIVPIYDAGSSEYGLYLAMALVPGTTLADRITAGTLSAWRALDVLDQVAEALDAAHAAGLVHRDVKPRNVLVTDADEAFVADFGLSTLADGDDETTRALVGTAAYLAPEVIRGGVATPASDRYAFAAVAFECLTGSVVFPRPTHAAQLFAHTAEPVPRISVRRDELPVALDAVFTRALAKAPDDRPSSAGVLIASIREVLVDDLAPASRLRAVEAIDDATGPLPPSANVKRPGAFRFAWLLLAGLVLGAGAAWAILDRDPEPAAAVLPGLPGAQILGSTLADRGVTRDCGGRAVRPESPACTLIQTRAPGRTVVAPRSGVIRRFALRDARGEFRLAVVRPRDGRFFQVALSDPAFVGDAQVHAFATDLPVEAGDLVALQVVSGSGFGVRTSDGAATARWSPWLRGVKRAPDHTADAQEIQLRVDYLPGESRALPRQIAGAAARALEPGETLARYRAVIVPGRPRQELRVVAAGPELALDLFRAGRREARLTLPGFVSGAGAIVAHALDKPDAAGAGAGLYLEYRRTDSARTSSHYVTLLERRLEFVS